MAKKPTPTDKTNFSTRGDVPYAIVRPPLALKHGLTTNKGKRSDKREASLGGFQRPIDLPKELMKLKRAKERFEHDGTDKFEPYHRGKGLNRTDLFGKSKDRLPKKDGFVIPEEATKHLRSESMDDPTPDTKVSLKSVANVLIGFMGADEETALSICRLVDAEDRKNKKKTSAKLSAPAAPPPVVPPEQPPAAERERWADRSDKSESPGHFIQRVYGDIPGLHRGHIREDFGLATAYARWVNDGSPDAPQGFHLASKSEAMLNEPAPPPGTTEALRYAERIRKRRQREAKKASER